MTHDDHHKMAESLRPKSDRELMLARIAADCGAAWQAAREGNHHPRHFSQMDSRKRAETARMAKQAAYYPRVPEIIVTEKFDPASAYHDFITRRYGLGGAERQE